jgi:hypothetical protein
MKLEPGQRVVYYPTARFAAQPVGAVVVREDPRPGWVVIRKDNFPNPICVRTTSLKAT